MKPSNENLPVLTAGSLEAQEAIVRAALIGSYDRLRGYLQRRFGGKAEAEEVLQAFMLRALERSGDIRDADSVRGWLSRVLATTIADFHRQASKSRTREMPFPNELNDRLAAEQDAAANAAVCECLHTHLSLLKPEHAEVIRRVDLAGEPRELVAAALGVTVNNLTVRLHRARHALKERLEQTCVVCLEESFWECRCGDNRGPT
ncbi:RNA polymerase sigma factor [Bradyrhizobium sp. CB1717]|uniref:RNA polymerase sigma factor n=1 Tax=Bradyrhizobium sp. CB1717 TaxID=3039154 RepID=UPI0024B169AF|nr:RNA polymerase sigma factor [Bradyrhizobium sp. CB1717]WFU20915.1 RNA polymerase sigma factor [Bradyrhizobium sp. CB1717]